MLKKLLILSTILGYIALAPICFLSAETSHLSTTNTSHTMTMSASDEDNCAGTGLHCIGHGDTTSGLGHHLSMYSLFSSFLQTGKFVSFADFANIILFAIFVPLLLVLVPKLSAHIHFYIKKSKQILNLIRKNFLVWLSLSINSPAYYLVM